MTTKAQDPHLLEELRLFKDSFKDLGPRIESNQTIVWNERFGDDKERISRVANAVYHFANKEKHPLPEIDFPEFNRQKFEFELANFCSATVSSNAEWFFNELSYMLPGEKPDIML